MAGPLTRAIDRRRLRLVRQRWAAAAEAAPDLDPFALRALQGEALAMRRQIDRLLQAAGARLAQPALSAPLPRQPLGTDWAWRPDAWRGPLPQPGTLAGGARTAVSADLALYHDCPLAEVVIRQLRGSDDSHRAPFGLALDVFGFRGSYLSLAMTLPAAALTGLKARHLIRADLVMESDRPLRAFARLNIRHGPNTAQLVAALPAEAGAWIAEFDLAYGGIDETRIERAWLDLILNDAAMTRILVRDLVVSRRPRAAL